MNYWRPTKNVRWPTVYKNIWALFLATFLLVGQVHATCIVVVVTRHGIVIGADGKIVSKQAIIQSLPQTSAIGTKIVVLQNKIAWATNGTMSIRLGQIEPYSFDATVQEVRKEIPSNVTVSQLADFLKEKLNMKFNGFDVLLKSGKANRRNTADEPFLQYVVAGYENGQPRAYTLVMDIDWNALHLKEPVIQPLHPGPPPEGKNINFYWAGNRERGIIEVLNRDSEAFKQASADMPVEMGAWVGDEDLSMPRMLNLARGLLGVEIRRVPETVGYPLTIISIPAGGTAKVRRYAQ